MYKILDSLEQEPQPLSHLARQMSGKTGKSPELMARWIRNDARVEVSARDLVYLRGRAPKVKDLTGRALVDMVYAMVSSSGPLSTTWLYSTYVGTTPFDGPQIYRLISSDSRLAVTRGTVHLAAPKTAIESADPVPSSAATGRERSPVRDPARNLIYRIGSELRRPVDELHLTCLAAGDQRVRLRCDLVVDQGTVELWVSAVIEDRGLFAVALDADALAPRDEEWGLPLRSAHAGSKGLVWKCVTEEAAADLIVAKIGVLGVAPEGVDLRTVVHDSADRRERERNVRVFKRLQARPRPRSGAVLGDCAKCGHPLTDPASAAIGIGPTCQKRYAPEVIAALRSNTSLVHPAVKRPKQWARSMRTWHSSLASRARNSTA